MFTFTLMLMLLVGAPQKGSTKAMNTLETATLGAGSFWCVEAVFQRIDGVKSVAPGYAGGSTANPTYNEVCSGTTGHAEVAQITFDPSKVSYEKILQIFWHAHDPTTMNRQGNDRGTQYRSAIFVADERQRAAAEAVKAIPGSIGFNVVAFHAQRPLE